MPAFRLTTERMMVAGKAAKRERTTVLRVFTAAQVALAVPLLVAAGLFVLSYANAVGQNLGFDQRNVVVVETNLFEVGGDFDATTAAHRLLRSELESMPEIETAAMVQYEPWQGLGTEFLFSAPGRELRSGSRPISVNKVDPAFFEVMRLPLIEGRFFTDAENVEGAEPVAVISETMARAIWGGESPVGQCVRIGSPVPPGVSRDEPACTEIIGVVGDARWSPVIRPTRAPEEMVFEPVEQEAREGALIRSILARTRTDAGTLVPQLRERLLAATNSLPYIDVRTFEETFAPLVRPWRLGATIFVVFGALALLIAAVGLIVVTSHEVTRRSHEFAVRSACGAQAGELVRSVLSRSVGTFAAGLTVGLLAALIGARLLEALLFDITAADVRVFGAATLSWLGCALVAAWLPARRAARIDPATALRSE
jgi:predicted permease